MGNSGSNDVTIEREGKQFVQTGDGIKLSTNLIQRLSSADEQKAKGGNTGERNSVKSDEAIRLAEECQMILDEREKQISELNKKWKADILNERAKHQKFYELSLEELEKSAQEVEEKFRKPTLKPVCENLQNVLVECYKNNSDQILNCSQQVKDFQNCVEHTKAAYLRQTKVGSA